MKKRQICTIWVEHEYIGHNDIEPENEGGKEQRNWHVLTLRKIKMGEI